MTKEKMLLFQRSCAFFLFLQVTHNHLNGIIAFHAITKVFLVV